MSRAPKSTTDDADAGECEYQFEVDAVVEVLWQEEGTYFPAKVRDRATVFFLFSQVVFSGDAVHLIMIIEFILTFIIIICSSYAFLST
jgi:hypothetical protein